MCIPSNYLYWIPIIIFDKDKIIEIFVTNLFPRTWLLPVLKVNIFSATPCYCGESLVFDHVGRSTAQSGPLEERCSRFSQSAVKQLHGHAMSSSSSVGATVTCGLWPVEQHLSICPCLSPTLSIFSLPTHEYLFPLLLSILSWVSSSCPFQFLSEDLFGNPILLHSLQVTQPPYPLALYPFYYIFYFIQLF